MDDSLVLSYFHLPAEWALMSKETTGAPITVEDRRSSQLALLKCCQQYQKKEKAGVLTPHEYNAWCECIEEHTKISAEIQRIQQEEGSWIVVEDPWVLVEKEDKK